jgi:hypothetical protein
MAPPDTLDDAELLALQRHHLLRRVVVYAVLLGGAAMVVIQPAPWGLNLAAWLALLIVATADLARRQSALANGLWLLLPALAFSVLAMGRASPLLAFFNFVATILALALHIAAAADPRFFVRGAAQLEESVRHLFSVALQGGIGAFRFLGGTERINLLFPALARRMPGGSLTAGIGTLVLIPLVTALLAAGDAVFRSQITSLLRFDYEEAFARLLTFGVTAWVLAGVGRHSLGQPGGGVALPIQSAASLPLASRRIAMLPLGALVGLFALFVMQQVRTLIGGVEYVARVTGLTLAEYARSGFFALCVAAAVALVVALWYQSRLEQGDAVSTARFRVLAVTLSVLLALLTAGAMVRMRLYIDGYGLTTDRFFASVVMIWTTFLAAWLARCAWLARPMAFVRGALVSAAALLLSMNLVNPERIIVEVNARRLARGAPFDLAYASADLGADAVPALVRVLLREHPSARDYTPPCTGVAGVLERWDPSTADEPTWRWGEHAAYRAVARRKAELRAVRCDVAADSAGSPKSTPP